LKNNRGSLFKNDKKQTDTQPDYNGSCLIDGVEYWVNAWLETSNGGKKYFSMSYKVKEPKNNNSNNDNVSDGFDDVPF
jgi:uncharacterized protein (DUF736 family)